MEVVLLEQVERVVLKEIGIVCRLIMILSMVISTAIQVNSFKIQVVYFRPKA